MSRLRLYYDAEPLNQCEFYTLLTCFYIMLGCDIGWVSSRVGSCYLFVEGGKNWNDARSDCQNQGADLAQITTPDKASKMMTIRSEIGTVYSHSHSFILITPCHFMTRMIDMMRTCMFQLPYCAMCSKSVAAQHPSVNYVVNNHHLSLFGHIYCIRNSCPAAWDNNSK